MLPRSKVSIDALFAMAQDKRAGERSRLCETISALFMNEADRPNERERALMRSILDRLLHDVEMHVRQRVSEQLADLPGAPPELVELLANDRIEIARPILLRSKVLRDPQLIEIIRQRGREHALAVSMRAGLSPDVCDTLVATGDEDVIHSLLRNGDAELSRLATEYLVAESERVGR